MYRALCIRNYELCIMRSIIYSHNFTLTNFVCCCEVIKLHDDQSEGLSRAAIVSMVLTASGNQLNMQQARSTWDKTILPYGRQLGLLTGYVKPQEGTSKRTAAGNADLQRDWHRVCSEMFAKIKSKAESILKDAELVHKMLPWLLVNLDEE